MVAAAPLFLESNDVFSHFVAVYSCVQVYEIKEINKNNYYILCRWRDVLSSHGLDRITDVSAGDGRGVGARRLGGRRGAALGLAPQRIARHVAAALQHVIRDCARSCARLVPFSL
jgi:hypothetical protein